MAAAQRALVRATYRAFMRESKRLTRGGERVSLVKPLDVRQWGTGSFTPASPDAAELQALLFPGVDFRSAGGWAAGLTEFDGRAVARLARAEYRRPRPDGAATGPLLDAAFAHLATLNRLRAAEGSRSVTRTKYGGDVVVDVELTTQFVSVVEPSAMAAMGQFPFVYRVRVTNRGAAPVQLLGRHWVFADTRGGVMEVPRNSPGVVGHSPVIEPGAAFEYTSGTQLGTPGGSMQGSFQMAANLYASGSPDMFDAVVVKTPLVGPPGLEELVAKMRAGSGSGGGAGGGGGGGAGDGGERERHSDD